MEEPVKSQEEKLDPEPLKRGRGRPSCSPKPKPMRPSGRPLKEADSSATQKQGQANKDNAESSAEILPVASRKRGRPPKTNKDSASPKTPGTVRKRGRPPKMTKGSSPTKVPSSKHKQGKTNKVIKRRGRPRKIPLTPEEEEERKKIKKKPKGPRVWKPLGRPRIYPRVEPPVPTHPVERRRRGRPLKSESKQGAHLRKKASSLGDGVPQKRGRLPGTTKAKTNGKELPSATQENEVQQSVLSPPPVKRSRCSTQGPPVFTSQNETQRKRAKLAEVGDSPAAVSPHKASTRSQPEKTVSENKDEEQGGPTIVKHASEPCQMLKKSSEADTVEEKAAKRVSGSRKTRVRRKVSQGRGRRSLKAKETLR